MVLCIDLGATRIKGALMENGRILRWEELATDTSGPDGIAAELRELTDYLLSPDTVCVGVVSAGDVDARTGIVTGATGNLPGFAGFDFKRFYRESYGLDCRAVNDAQGALLGEAFYGAAKDFRLGDIAMLTLGSGVGGAYFSRGRISVDPAIDFARFGHLCLKPGGRTCNCGRTGCIEQYVSGRALNRMTEDAGMPAGEIFPQARQNHLPALAVLEEYFALLAQSVQRVLETVHVDLMILGGGVAEGAGELLDEYVRTLPVPAVRAALGNRAGVYGAFCLTQAQECAIIC